MVTRLIFDQNIFIKIHKKAVEVQLPMLNQIVATVDRLL